MSNLSIAVTIVLSILAVPTVFLLLAVLYSNSKEVIMHFVYKFNLFNSRQKWLHDHPDWDKSYSGNSMLAGFIDYCSKTERPW